MVKSSVTVISSTSSKFGAFSEPLSGFMMASIVNFTSAAVKGSPSCHVTPDFRWKV